MAARDEQEQIGEFEARIGEAGAERMAFEMVDRDQRLVRGVRERLAGDEPDHHPADQPRSGGRGDRVDVGERHSGVGKHALDDRCEPVDMRARRDLGDDAAIGAMLGFLPRDALRQNAPLAVDERRRGFVAARFKAKDEGHVLAPLTRAPGHGASGRTLKIRAEAQRPQRRRGFVHAKARSFRAGREAAFLSTLGRGQEVEGGRGLFGPNDPLRGLCANPFSSFSGAQGLAAAHD